MTRKALLIGAQTGGLTGVVNDVKSMSVALEQRGFVTGCCEAEDASRAGILDAYERLIADAEPDDAIVVYYSGHGGYSRPPDFETSRRPRMPLQFIVPVDIDESTEGDFRGITSVELSLLLMRLTSKTRNVVVILDCCHSAHMSRRYKHLRVKAQPRPVAYSLLEAHLDVERGRGDELRRWNPQGNPYAVRIVACEPDQSAYEYENELGVRTGMLTEALTRALTEAGDLPVTWSTIMERVRQRVLTLMPSQRPEAEGPSRRLLFQTIETNPVTSLPLVVTPGTARARVEGASLLGVRVGDEFAVMPVDSTGPDEATKLGDLRVDRLEALGAWGDLRLRASGVTLEPGARAHRTTSTAEAMPVLLPQDGPGGADLMAHMSGGSLVRSARLDEPHEAEVLVDAMGDLVVCDRLGPLHPPRSRDETGRRLVIRDLNQLARANALRRLTEDPAHALDVPIDIEFGLATADGPKPLCPSGSVLYVGQHVYVRVINDSDEGSPPVWVSLFDIGVAAKIIHLNPWSPSGVPLAPGKEYIFGWNDFTGTLAGLPLLWPSTLERSLARPETIVILVTSEAQDLRVFEQDGIRGPEAGPRSNLQRALDQIATGTTRDLLARSGHAVRYAVHTVDFDLVPVDPPAAETASFQIDDRPEPSVRLWTADPPAADLPLADLPLADPPLVKDASPVTVAVRLTDLVVHHNRAFGHADIRLDAIVLTGGGSGSQPVCHTQTKRFTNIRDGDRLPLDRMLVYHGPAVDYLDLAVWVSRDSEGSRALSDLMRARLTDTGFQSAVVELDGLLVAAPHAAVAAAAVGASAIIINTAYSLLRGVVGDSIGLYRTTLLAHERFGVGRHPEQNTVRAQDFTFGYTIEQVG